MIDLSKPWPFGLTRRSALPFAFAFVVLVAALYWIDRPLSAWAQALPDAVRAVFHWITRWGQSDWILIPSATALLIAWLASLVTRERRQQAAREVAALAGFIFVGVAAPSLVASLLKRIIGRGRPETWSVETPLTFHLNWDAYDFQSFPSGHSTTAFSAAMAVALLWPRLLWPALLAAALIALSRIVEGAHYATDITGGAVLGTLGAYAVRNFFAARGWAFEIGADGGIRRKPLTALFSLRR